MRNTTLRLLSIVSLATLGAAQSEAPRFVERPGIVEFSGLMIVRPVQPATLVARGLSEAEGDAVRERAAGRLRARLVEYVPATDEYIVNLPAGRDENQYARELLRTGDYEYAEPDWLCFPVDTLPNDQSYSMQWHHPKVHSPRAWDITTGDPNLVIAIVDGGVQLDHPDLAGALVSGYNAQDRLAQSAGGDVSDVDGHGTFVAGLAGAIGNNGIHVTGMGWNFKVMPVRYYNTAGGGYLHNLLDGARWAADNGARCVNVSQSGVEYSTVQTTGTYVKSKGSLLLYAAGNDGRDLNWFDWSDVIVVGATDQADNKASFSAFGLAVDVYAPGTDIISTGMVSGLAIGSGTSASTPIATGICGLIWSLHPTLTPDQVEEHLFAGCVDLGVPGNDDYFGWGRVDAPPSLARATSEWYCGTGVNAAGDGFVVYSPPVLGGAFLATVTGCAPGNVGAFLVAYSTPLTFMSPFGEVLVNLSDPGGELLGMPTATGNPPLFLLSVPNDPVLVGFVFHAQAASFGGAICLHCAHRGTVGF